MYRILYLGQDKTIYSRLRENLPIYMRLEPEYVRTRLEGSLRSAETHGIILPLYNPGPEDLSFLKGVIGIPEVPGVIVTANYMTTAQAVCCMRYGAFDCLTGTVNGEVMGACLNRMIHHSAPGLQAESESSSSYDLIAGNSTAVKDLRNRLIKYSELPYPVLITGETGSGKELAAKMIHNHSNRSNGPFTAVNCAAYPDDLLGSEMFGSRKGAFTGSIDRPGLIESSSGGTLFLDEIAELSLRGQASLLRVIEDGCVRRMGSHTVKSVDIRIVAATNQDLRYCMKQGTFRSDLFYRLNLLGVSIPPLRKRKGDIPRLVRDYLEKLRIDLNWRVDSTAMSVLINHNWPGNVRELQSVLLGASLSAGNGILRVKDIRIPDSNY